MWRVVSDSGEDPQISSQGTPPATLPGLIDKDVDHHFEVPFKLVTEATGGTVDTRGRKKASESCSSSDGPAWLDNNHLEHLADSLNTS
ncbi:hypothetical protein ACIBF1_17075 [Spirillospora sp. NPDC050679]